MNQYQNRPYQDDDIIDLADIFATLWRGKWWVISITALCFVGALLYVLIATPVYSAKALLQLQPNQAEAAIEVIKSEAVLDQVIASNHLDIIAKPQYLPIIGRALACNSDPEQCAPGKHIKVETFDLPETLQEQPFTLLAGEHGEYQLIYDGENILAGKVGEKASTTFNQQTITIKLAKLDAPEGTAFNLEKLTKALAVGQLLDRLTVVEQTRNTDILAVTVNGPFTSENEQIVKSAVNAFEQYWVEATLLQLDKQLQPLEAELKIANAALGIAKDKLESFQRNNSSVNLNELSRVESIKKRQKLIGKFGDTDNKENLGTLIGLELQQEVNVKNDLFTSILQRWQKLETSLTAGSSNVVILSNGVSTIEPIKPKKAMIVGIVTLLGLMVSMGLVFLKAMMTRELKKEELESCTQLKAYAAIPLNPESKKAEKSTGQKNGKTGLLANTAPNDQTVESLRTLRTNLLHDLTRASNKCVMLTSPKNGAGKSFIAANLAELLAQVGKKVLLMDGDLRKANLSHYFNNQALRRFIWISGYR
ncbi:GNVR domain-containing protein [Endozoicomonas ascidiicola]|uniref:GNVR domain-containing protein n=1 Tax=Endozoicomonas ascidiicola TaxID=1698521 RepID=UPI000831212B|nr:GNVR domain-containing protein [Endozoicomonas ascidiicola]